MSDNARILTLAGELGRALARIPEDSCQLEDLASVLRTVKDAIRHPHVSHDVHLLACDIEDCAQEVAEEEL